MSSSITTNEPFVAIKETPFIEGIGFDLVIAMLSLWFINGLFIDGWAHLHGRVDKTFFTPWHAIFYSGYFVTALALVAATFINHRRGYTWLKAIPHGHEFAFFAVPLFAIGGIGDLIWHTLFGFEVGIEPLLSPTHLLLAFSILLMTSGPLRATWQRREDTSTLGWASLLPMILSLVAVYATFTFLTMFAHPVVEPWLVTHATNDSAKSRGAAEILLQAAILMGVLLFAIRRWRLPFGVLTLLFTVNTLQLSVLSDTYYLIPAALLAGLVADVLVWRLQPSLQRPEMLRLFAFAVPLVFYLLYFATLGLLQGITWSIHLWLGSCVLAGVVGLLLSYVMVGPQVPVD
jgi:hypothetical protein